VSDNTIYKRTKTGAIQTWSYELDGPRYRTISGQLGGAQIVSEWTDAVAKNVGRANQKTAEEQAAFEADAKRRDKLKRGYFESVDEVDNDRGFFEPMTALIFKEKFKFVPGTTYFSQPKLDGFRCVAYPGRLQSRSGKRDFVSCPHILDDLAAAFEKYPNVKLDGELYNHKLKEDFNEISSLVTETEGLTADDYEISRQLIQYHVYDCFDEDRPNLTFLERISLVNEIAELFGPSIKVVHTWPCSTPEEIDAEYKTYLDEVYEGQMIRMDTPYENKRTKNLLKRKEFIDGEFEITSIAPGRGKRAKVAGRVWCKLPDGRPFKASVKGNMAYAKKLLDEAEEYVGGQCTVRYVHLTPDGKPRFGVAYALHRGERIF
jgi:DNA ligase-1